VQAITTSKQQQGSVVIKLRLQSVKRTNWKESPPRKGAKWVGR